MLSQGLAPLALPVLSEGSPPPCPPDGLASFRSFLRSEFSEENAEFWVACEDYKKTKSPVKMAEKAKKIYEEFIQTEAPKEVSGHRAGDGTGRNEAAAVSGSIPKETDDCRVPPAWLRGLEGCILVKGQPHPHVLHYHPSQTWSPCWLAQPLLGCLQPWAPPTHACPPLPHRGVTSSIRADNVQ